MKIAVFSTKPYDEKYLRAANREAGHELHFFEARLTRATAPLAEGFPAVSVFVNDQPNAEVLEILHAGGTRMLALRSAGFNHVDLDKAWSLGMTVSRVPAYSPYAVAEHTLALVLGLNRKIYRAYNRVREGNFSLDGLLGFDLHGKTVGLIGTGKIGALVARIFVGFGCRILAYDVHQNKDCLDLGVVYQDLPDVLGSSDIVSLHCPLTPATHHIIRGETVAQMKKGAMLVNTSRGPLIETQSVIDGLKSGQIGSLALDVYEEEGDLFFEDLSSEVIRDDVFMRLLTFPNVLITGHQAFFTQEALINITETTIGNVTAFAADKQSGNELSRAILG